MVAAAFGDADSLQVLDIIPSEQPIGNYRRLALGSRKMVPILWFWEGWGFCSLRQARSGCGEKRLQMRVKATVSDSRGWISLAARADTLGEIIADGIGGQASRDRGRC
jgi:hypothetical protein